MDERPLSLLPALAAEVSSLFPELEGRSIAVSEAEPFNDKSNVPTLPLSFVALVSESNVGTGGRITLQDDILIQFIFKPVRYTRIKDGAETPFYAYYDYEIIRDRLLAGLKFWRTPRNASIRYHSMDVESDSFAVYIAFRFRTSEEWCAPEVEPDGVVRIDLRMCEPRNQCCDCLEEPDGQNDPC